MIYISNEEYIKNNEAVKALYELKANYDIVMAGYPGLSQKEIEELKDKLRYLSNDGAAILQTANARKVGEVNETVQEVETKTL